MKNNLLKPVILSILISGTLSYASHFIFPAIVVNDHWLYSIAFLSILSIIINLFYIQKTDNHAFTNIIMVASVSRFLASAAAFFIYTQLFPDFNKAIVIHFMLHYFVFAFFEIIFLLKIVNSKNKTHE